MAGKKQSPLAVDGSQIDAILTLLGAPKKPTAETNKTIAEIERWIGKSLPAETKTYLSRPLDLWNNDADHPKIKDSSWLGALPDVGAWVEQLGRSYEGRYHAVNQFFGLYPIGCQINRGDHMFAHVVLEPYAPRLGGVMYYDEREIGTWGGSVSAFLLQELVKFNDEIEGARDEDDPKAKIDLDELSDCFRFAHYDWKKSSPPPSGKLSPHSTPSGRRTGVGGWSDAAGGGFKGSLAAQTLDNCSPTCPPKRNGPKRIRAWPKPIMKECIG
jgi:hypothetical protein